MRKPIDRFTRETATKAVLHALLDLTRDEDPSVYYFLSSVARKVSENNPSYGRLLPKEVSDSLDEYVPGGLVRKVIIKDAYKNASRYVYSINHSKIEELEALTKE